MRMRIFTNEILDENDIDFTRWQTVNGDYVRITEVGTAYIERSLDYLAIYSERYPNHPNYSIWQHYIGLFEQELLEREFVLA